MGTPETKIAVCDYYQLARLDGKFSKEHKTKLRDNMPVKRETMEFINSQWEQCGKFYIEDTKASIEFEKRVREDVEVRKKNDEVNDLASKALVDTIASVSKSRANKNNPAEEESKKNN